MTLFSRGMSGVENCIAMVADTEALSICRILNFQFMTKKACYRVDLGNSNPTYELFRKYSAYANSCTTQINLFLFSIIHYHVIQLFVKRFQ